MGEKSVFNYHLLRHALNRYQRNLVQLDDLEKNQVERLASKSFELENRVLSSREAALYSISDSSVEKALIEVKKRYESEHEFEADLKTNGLDCSLLESALRRELIFDGVMQLVGARNVDINEVDVRLFYEMHSERFKQREKRLARHILITINDQFPENHRAASVERINQIKQKLNGRTNRFPNFAKRYSECPTALEGGKLGEVEQGCLYPQIDHVLFTMKEDSLSDIIETEVGFHLIYCEKIKPAKLKPYNLMRSRIEALLTERQQRQGQRSWLSQLEKAS